MDKYNTDIELINKYLKGELEPSAMQELEARALDDPFLQDAMEGYENFPVREEDLKALSSRLEERLKTKQKIIGSTWGVKQWGIAASIILCISVISIFLNQTPENKTIALSDLQKKNDIPKDTKIALDSVDSGEEEVVMNSVADESPGLVANDINQNKDKLVKSYSPEDGIEVEPLLQKPITHDLDTTTGLNEVVVVGYGTPSKKSVTGAVSSIPSENLMASRMAKEVSRIPEGLLKGRITDATNGGALPGVSVKDEKLGAYTQTDKNGEFSIPVQDKANLKINYIGFEPKSLIANANDSLNIALQPDTKALSEVVVVGYGMNSIDRSDVLAGPNGGWHKFRKQMDENAYLENHQKGKVQVKFNILENGKLSELQIVSSFSEQASAKALALIKTYSGWHGSKDGKPQSVIVTLRFK